MFKGNKSSSTFCFHPCLKLRLESLWPTLTKIQTPGRSQTNLLGFLNRCCRHFGLPDFYGPNNFQTHRVAVTCWHGKSGSSTKMVGASRSLILGVQWFPFWTADFFPKKIRQVVWRVVWIHVPRFTSKASKPPSWEKGFCSNHHLLGASAIRFLGLYIQNQRIWWSIRIIKFLKTSLSFSATGLDCLKPSLGFHLNKNEGWNLDPMEILYNIRLSQNVRQQFFFWISLILGRIQSVFGGSPNFELYLLFL